MQKSDTRRLLSFVQTISPRRKFSPTERTIHRASVEQSAFLHATGWENGRKRYARNSQHFACVLLSSRVTRNDANKIMRNSSRSLLPFRLCLSPSLSIYAQSHVPRNEVAADSLNKCSSRRSNGSDLGANYAPESSRFYWIDLPVPLLFARTCGELRRLPRLVRALVVRVTVDNDEISVRSTVKLKIFSVRIFLSRENVGVRLKIAPPLTAVNY